VTELGDLVARLGGTRALVLGDVMLDEYVWGQVNRISPEAPVPVVDVRTRTYVPGGAANVAVGIAALGGRALLGGIVGDDPAAAHLRDALAERGLGLDGLLAVAGRSTTTKTRVIAHSQQVVRADVEERKPLPAETAQELRGWAEARLADIDVVVLSDYAKGVVSAELAQGVIERSREAGKPVVVDPKGSDYAKYGGATVLTPNIADAKRAAHLAPESFVELAEVASRLAAVVPGSALLITRGAEGMSLLSESGSIDVPAAARDVYDVTGAGDTVVAALAVALGSGLRLEDAVRLANAAAGLVVSKVGTASVTLGELSSAAAGEPPSRSREA
jgi:D-beta-D-heptose 7-phosphate kinase/D-beta-D-heptose 1-phosphate adenosyltransferase